MKSYKILLALLLCLLSGTLFASDFLNVHVGTQRFLDKNQNTVIHIDYQIPYNGLVFQAFKGGYFAQVEMKVEVMEADSLVFEQVITDNIGITNKDDINSSKSYLNRVSYQIDRPHYQFKLSATDVLSQKQLFWGFSAEQLHPQVNLSDLELCSEVRPDSSSYLERFHRGKTLYRTQPSHIFDKNDQEFMNLYFEVYSTEEQRAESSLLVLTVEKDSLIIFDQYIDFIPLRSQEGISLKIPLQELSVGKYVGSLDLQLGEKNEHREFEFFVTEPKASLFYLFTNPDDDLRLLRYFVGYSEPAQWKSYDEQTKRRFVSQLWKDWSQSGTMSTQAAIDIVRERVDYSNQYFSFFDQGWTTDMGRIHIRNGKPDEIEKGTSSDDTRYVRKDYQIWKYSSRNKPVYLFVDIQMNGNYRLIYVDNDDRESSNPDFLRYLGSDFDTSLLNN